MGFLTRNQARWCVTPNYSKIGSDTQTVVFRRNFDQKTKVCYKVSLSKNF